jgi:hypothetical protein
MIEAVVRRLDVQRCALEGLTEPTEERRTSQRFAAASARDPLRRVGGRGRAARPPATRYAV